MNWYYIDGPLRVGPIPDTEWAELVRSGKIQPDTLVWQEGMEKWTPFREASPPAVEPPPFGAAPEPTVEAEDPNTFAARVVDLDYAASLRRCISRGWKAFLSDYWMLVGSTFLIYALTLAGASLPVVHTAMSMGLQGVLLGGLYCVGLRILRGEPAFIRDLFSGFSLALLKPLLLTTLVSFLVMVVCFLPATIATEVMGMIPANFEAMMTGDPQSQAQALTLLWQTWTADPQKTLVWLLVILTCSLPAVYFTFCWMFSIPLIVDKGLDFWPAMQLSRRKVLQHPWRVAVLVLAAEALGFSGALGFGIGVIFTLPLAFLVKLALYEEIFNNAPPSRMPGLEKE